MTPAVAIVGMGCRYPDAGSPEALWENMLAQRRTFRHMPAERLNLDDYGSSDRNDPDRTYTAWAAVLEGYAFDRMHFRVSGDTFRSVDMAHWLALDVATQALRDAGFPDGEGLPHETTGVLLGNTLTGEFSRASLMRLRWPYVRRVLDAALVDEGWEVDRRSNFLASLEVRYKNPFPPVGTETLAGGLSNTIAGRICNFYDLKGGGYTVDGACASSLLAVIHACAAVAAGELDVALAGGVDLSLDPFELVGFARIGALAERMMRVYDARSEGFWPGEGCGFVVLMRHEEALRQGRCVYAVIRGWGVSSDGSGGITRPEVEGQLLAVRRAWQRAGFGVETAALFEGHGTGTSVGDATELQMLSRARREAVPDAPPAVIGSIKANIGHTKAAAGVAGLLKTTLALHHQILPPMTGCKTPHAELTSENPALRVLKEGERWPLDRPLRAGVSAMGFGGINTHVVLENPATERYDALTPRERALLVSAQDTELFLLGAEDTVGLRRQVDHLLTLAPKLSLAELADLAAQLAATLESRTVRAAIVASTPSELTEHLETLVAWLKENTTERLGTDVYLSPTDTLPKIGFLFPGQGSPTHLDGGAWRRRLAAARMLYAAADFPKEGDSVATEVAQPAIVTASMAALRVLEWLGITAQVAVGHSLGELTALHWAGALDEPMLLRLATVRGSAMADLSNPTGTMASLATGPDEVEALIRDEPVVIAGLNGPEQTVISGEEDTVSAVVARARARGMQARILRVSHAFHSPLVAAAAEPLAAYLRDYPLRPVQRTVVSTITGSPIDPDEDLTALLVRQVTSPVRFTEAVETVVSEVDLWIEAGPGQVLSGLVRRFTKTPVVATDAGSSSLRGLLQTVGAAFVLGAPVQTNALFGGRFTRPFRLDWQPQFLVNPCELAPGSDSEIRLPEINMEALSTNGKSEQQPSAPYPSELSPPPSSLKLVRHLVAERAELPLNALRDKDRLLSDLHLNSITVSELVTEAAQKLNLPPSAVPTDYADSTIAEVAEALEERMRLEDSAPVKQVAAPPSGIEAWIRPFTVALVERTRPRARPEELKGTWRIIAPKGHPLKAALEKVFRRTAKGSGTVVALPPDPGEEHIGFLLEGAREVMAKEGPKRFVLVQRGGGAASFARTLHLEAPALITCVVDVPTDHPEAAAWVLAEAEAAAGYTEAIYNTAGVRREPRLRLLSLDENTGALPLGPNDVLLITGGGKGITAECAFALGYKTGAQLVLLGRSQPSDDAELAATLERMADAGLRCHYITADVTDAEAVHAAVAEAEATFGPVTAVIHGAARNVPQRLSALDEVTIRKTLAPKVQGLRNVLAAVNPERLHLLITFGSIIGRMGLPGEADYALANEWLTQLTDRWQQEHPHCRCLAVEWSIWSAVGMGARLGSIDALIQRGITPISPDAGTALLLRLLAHPLPTPTVVVTGRFGEPPTLQIEEPELPFLRFLEQPRVYYPGVELVVDVKLSVDTDPYLDDHVLQGERLLPAVMGLEAMAQAATALAHTSDTPRFEDVAFLRPVIVSDDAPVTVRLAAYVRTPGQVEVALRSETTAFQTDHFRALCRFDPLEFETSSPPLEAASEAPPVALDPDQDLYGSILFHRGRFKRLRGYRRLRATSCVAEIAEESALSWFSRYLPADLVLGDPGARDAAVHAIQACIPHATLVPIGVDRLVIEATEASGIRFVHAYERSRDGDTFVYDVAVTNADGHVLERWDGLRLQRVANRSKEKPWAAPLFGPYIERRLQELTSETTVSVAVMRDGAVERRTRSDRSIQQALGADISIQRRPNGKPEARNGKRVSAAHAGDLTLAIAGAEPLGCDVEPVAARPEAIWRSMLGPERCDLARLIAQKTGEDLDTTATRVWTALECLKKAGSTPTTPLVLDACSTDGWVVLASGVLRTATLAASVRGIKDRLVYAVLTGSPRQDPVELDSRPVEVRTAKR